MSASTAKDIFLPLTNLERLEKLEVMGKTRAELLIWEKGAEKREFFNALDFIQDKNQLEVVPLQKDSDYAGKKVIINIKFADLQFFTSGTLTRRESNDRYFVDLDQKLYKCDKRKNYRLKSSDLQTVKIAINGKEYPANDVSVGGISIMLKPKEASFIAVGKVYEDSKLTLNNFEIIIPKTKVAHTFDVGTGKKAMIKVGFQFMALPDSVESKLFVQINNILYKMMEKVDFD